MNSKERRKHRKLQSLAKLGRMAAVEIAAAESMRDDAISEAERLKAIASARLNALQGKLDEAKTLEEALAGANDLVAEVKAQASRELVKIVEEHRELLRQTIEMNDAALQVRLEEQQRELAAIREELEGKLKASEAVRAALAEEREEPDRLRRRLRAKEEEIVKLQTELCQVKSRLLSEQLLAVS